MSQEYTPKWMKLDASIVKEAAEVLQMVADSGVTLPPNWRWPLLDELSGIAYAMQQAALRQQAVRVDVNAAAMQVAALIDSEHHKGRRPTAHDIRAALEAALSAQPAERQSGAIVVGEVAGGDPRHDGKHMLYVVSDKPVCLGTKLSIHPASPTPDKEG